MEGERQSSPFKEFRQFYFGSLLRDIITLLRKWPHLHFEPSLAAEMTPRTTVPKRRGARNSRTGRRARWTSPRPVRDGAAAISISMPKILLPSERDYAYRTREGCRGLLLGE